MGFSGTYLFDGTDWTARKAGYQPKMPEPWLLITIFDSDIAMVVYEPTGPGVGCAFLGYTPRTFFEDETMSAPTDVAREAKGLAAWWAGRNPEATDLTRAAKSRELQAYLVADGGHPDLADDADDAEVFVEVKAARFLNALGLSRPDELGWAGSEAS